MTINLRRAILITEAILLGIALLYLLYWHWIVGNTRFFDVDEFTHLHWAANMARGERPYVDFFTFFTPGFYILLAPIFWIYGKSVMIFLAARAFAFIVFTALVGVTGSLAYMLRSWRHALLTMVILAFLPMPFDKLMELRPDNVATLLGLIGVILQIRAMMQSNAAKSRRIWFAAGVSYSLSLIVLVKTLPFVVAGFAFYFVYFFPEIKSKRFRDLLPFVYGFAGPAVLTAVWALSLGDISRVWYSLTRLAFEANTIGRVYIMESHLFFFPNASFYGGWGLTYALFANHALWTIGILYGCYRSFTPYITANGDRTRTISELLIGSIFIMSVAGYVLFFPLKHSQYLIPIALFIAFYSADWILGSMKKFGIFRVIVLAILLVFLMGQGKAVNTPKLTMTNTVQLEQAERLMSLISENDQVLDLDGRLLFWKDPYYICCLPFGSFVRFLSRPPENLAAVLSEKKVAYIFQGDTTRMWELSDISYIQANYERVPGWGDSLWKRK